MRVQLVLVALLLAALGLCGWWVHANFEYVTADEPQPPRGQASYDPLYAASLALQAYGSHTVVMPYFDLRKMQLKRDDTLVFYSDVRTLSQYELMSLKKWVESGGHLVVRLQMGEDSSPPLLQSFGIQVGPIRHWVCPVLGFTPGETTGAAEVCGTAAVRGSPQAFAYSLGNGSDLLYAQQYVGQGWLAVVSSMDFMTNWVLKEPANIGLMLRVVQPGSSPGRIFLVYSLDEPGLPQLLLKYGWPVLLSLAVLLLALLLAKMPRFGPPLPAAPPPRRALLEHVRASAETLWRHGGERGLYDAVRGDMLLTLRRRHPAAAAAQRKELLTALTEISGLPRLQVRRALAMDSVDVRSGFVERIATLLEIRKRL